MEAVRAGDIGAVRSLLAKNADVNASQPDGATPLAWAVYRNDDVTADLLISAGADVNKANDYGVTPLWLACENRNGAMVDKLLQTGANPNAALWTGETVLMTCASAGVVDGVEALVARGALVNATEPRRGQTALMWAVAARHAEVVKKLLQHGADVRARSHAPRGFKPMVFATWGKDVTASSMGGYTPLLFAAQQGDAESAQLFLNAGADVNEVGPEGMTPLLLAAASGHEAVALALLKHGADVQRADASGATALHYALRDGLKVIYGLAEKPDVQPIHSKDPTVLAKLSQLALVSTTQKPPSVILPGTNMGALAQALLARGADRNAQLVEIPSMLRLQPRSMISLLGATPFLLASVVWDTPALQLLLEHGADPSIGTRVDERQMAGDGYSDDAQVQGNATPLLVAAGLGRETLSDEEQSAALEAARLLISRGANVRAASATGWTPLHAAAYLGADRVVQLLLENGATIDVQNGCGQTPLSLAKGDDTGGLLSRTTLRASTVDLLQKLGAGRTKPAGPVGKCVKGRYGI